MKKLLALAVILGVSGLMIGCGGSTPAPKATKPDMGKPAADAPKPDAKPEAKPETKPEGAGEEMPAEEGAAEPKEPSEPASPAEPEKKPETETEEKPE